MLVHSVATIWIQSDTLMKNLLGDFYIFKRRSHVGILAKYWIAMAWYLICIWCLTVAFTLILVRLM